jgi:hypothetical protein
MGDKKVYEWLRLKDNHPTMQKIEKLFAYMDELGLSLEVIPPGYVGGPCSINDKERPGITFVMSDLDNPNDAFNSFPPTFEYKVLYENPEWKTEREKQREESRKAFEAKRKEEEKQRRKEEAERVKQENKRIEDYERKVLADLKAKYER